MDLSTVFEELDSKATQYAAGCVYELFISRMNAEVLNIVGTLPDAVRDAFLKAAEAKGFYAPKEPSGWLLEATQEYCVHGLDYQCCPCGCGDFRAEMSIR